MKKNITIPLLFLLLSFCNLQKIKATHGMGADLTYSCIALNTYEFTLIFYRDCEGINAPNMMNLTISSPSGCGNNLNLALPLQGFVEVSPLCAAQVINSSCNGGVLKGVEAYEYQGVVVLPNACNDWVASFNHCCRNAATITNSNGGNLFVEAKINNLNGICNNSPEFSSLPVPYICEGQAFAYNQGANDMDGDSLVYTLIDPKTGTNTTVNHFAGFSAIQPLATTGPFNFDANTGQMNFIPNGNQTGIITILVEEFRNGQFIGSVMRDIQAVVMACPNNNVPIPSPINNLTGGVLNANSIETCVGNLVSFDINCPDANPADIVTITNNIAANLNGAVVNVVNGNPATIQVNWLVNSINNQSFYINFDDGACLIPGRANLGFVIKPTSVSFPSNDSIICPGISSKQLQALAGNGSYTWNNGATLDDPNIANPTATIINTPVTYTVTYTDQGGCVAVNSLTIAEHTMDLAFNPDTNQLQFCQGDLPINLNAQLNGDVPIPIPGGYAVNPIPFFPIPLVNPIVVPLNDDQVSPMLPLGFNFNFWGNNYTTFKISSNGFITFNNNNASGCCTGQLLPNNNNPNNLIAFAWEDLDPGNGGQPGANLVRYETRGIAPNRVLIVDFFNVDHFPNGNRVTSQLHLFETTNRIHIHTTAQPDAVGNHTMGIEDATGNNAVVVPGRNRQQWVLANDGIEFSPIPAGFVNNYTYNWTPIAGLNNGNSASVTASPNQNTSYTCTADDGICQTTRTITIGCILLNSNCNDFSLKQKNKQIQLSWSIDESPTCLDYRIERSTNGIDFETIAKLERNSVINGLKTYRFLDTKIADGTTYYYRLKQHDIDGSMAYICSTQTIKTKGDFLNDLRIIPNPSRDIARLQYHIVTDELLEISLLDVMGRRIIELGSIKATTGNNSIVIPTAQLAAGIYYIKITNQSKGFQKLKKLIKQ